MYPNLETLKLGGNKITDFKVVEILKKLKNLVNLDLEGTDISKRDNFVNDVFEALPNLQVLNGKDRDGNSVISQEDDEEDEEGDDGDFIQDGEISEGTKQKLLDQGFVFDDEGEEGEEELDDEEEEEVKKPDSKGTKRTKTDE